MNPGTSLSCTLTATNCSTWASAYRLVPPPSYYLHYVTRSSELALLKFQVQVEFLHLLENLFGSFGMGGSVRGVDEEVVHVDDELSFCDEVPE